MTGPDGYAISGMPFGFPGDVNLYRLFRFLSRNNRTFSHSRQIWGLLMSNFRKVRVESIVFNRPYLPRDRPASQTGVEAESRCRVLSQEY